MTSQQNVIAPETVAPTTIGQRLNKFAGELVAEAFVADIHDHDRGVSELEKLTDKFEDEILYFMLAEERRRSSGVESVVAPFCPTKEMLIAARDWSSAKYGKPIGNEAAIGCYQTMLAVHRLPTQSQSEELLAAEAENSRLREVVDDMRVEVARITNNAATEIVKFRAALERIALMDEADGHELTVDHAFQAIAIATKALGKHPSEIHKERYTAPAQSPLSQGGVTLRELGESYCEEQPAPGTKAVAAALKRARKHIIHLGGDPTVSGPHFGEALQLDVIDQIDGALAALRSPAIPAPAQGVAVTEIAAERRRQIEQEGWSAEHDDKHTDMSLSRAAACYAMLRPDRNFLEKFWPWESKWWKPSTQRRDLIKAAALIVAEIERLDRAALHPAEKGK